MSEATVFNYFPTMEDLFYSGLEAFGAQLVDAVRTRPAGEPVPVTCQRFLLEVYLRVARTPVISKTSHTYSVEAEI